MIQNWISTLLRLVNSSEKAVLVTVISVDGSAPREVGAKLIVTNTGIYGSIGGGLLEHMATSRSRTLLAQQEESIRGLETVSLGANLGQCCGGKVVLSFEKLSRLDQEWLTQADKLIAQDDDAVIVTSFGHQTLIKRVVERGDSFMNGTISQEIGREVSLLLDGNRQACLISDKTTSDAVYFLDPMVERRPELWLFGAGHIGRAIVDVIDDLPFRLHWVDSRESEFPLTVPSNTTIHLRESPVSIVDNASPNALFLVLTHDHQLDLDLCEAILKRNDFSFFGLIGSKTKKTRFLRRLKSRGVSDLTLTRMNCPIGINGVSGKRPKEIAISVAAQLLQISEVLTS